MAAKLSNVSDKMSEANLQVEGQVEKPAQGAADQQEMEEEDSSPHNLPMWSSVQRLLLGCLNMKHSLEIQVILTYELGDMPPTYMLGQLQWWRICCEEPELDLLRQ